MSKVQQLQGGGGGINNYGDRRCKDAAKLCEYGESRSVPSRRVKQRWDFNSGSSDALIENKQPLFLLGKVLRTYPKRREALLAHLAPVPNTRIKYTS